MPVRVDLSSHASVRLICVDEDNTACAYLANLYIPVFALDTGKVIHTFDVHNQIVGLQLRPEKKHTLYAIDDSFGMHIFDVRTNNRNKKRLNPEVENHNVVCTALSSGNILAVSSSEFGGGILDVRGSRRREHHPHAVTLFDIRYAGEPVTTYAKKHGAEVTCMEFYKNGHDLITGNMHGGVKVFNTQLRDEDNACRWERWMKGPITKVGVINKRILYAVGERSQCTVFVDHKAELEVLYGSVQETADVPITKTSKAFYKKPEWCLGMMKGVNDDLPLVAVHGVEDEKFISLTAMDQRGVRQEKPLLTYAGHTGIVKCMTATSKLLLTGGEDGKVVIQYSDFKNPQFGHDSIPDHRLTLNRGNLAERHDAGEDYEEPEPEPEPVPVVKKESSDSNSDASDSDEAPSKKKNSKPTTSSASAPSTSAAAASAASSTAASSSAASSSSKPGQRPRTASEEILFQKFMREENILAKKRERKEKLRKEMKKRDRKKKSTNGWETVDEDEERIEIEKREKEEKEKRQARIAAGLEVEVKEKPKKKKKLSGSFPKKSRSVTPDKDKPSTSAASSSSKKESKEERAARKEREAKEARRKARKEKEAEEERKAKEEREKRKAMKLAETKEERAARKDRERKEREREERKREERKKEERKKQKSGEDEPKSKKSKLK